MRNPIFSKRSKRSFFAFITIFSLAFGTIISPYQATASDLSIKNFDTYSGDEFQKTVRDIVDWSEVDMDKKVDLEKYINNDIGTSYSDILEQLYSQKNISTKLNTREDYVAGEILVKYKDTKINLNTTAGRSKALKFISSKLLETKEDLRKNNISVLRIKDTKTVEQKIAELKNDPNVEYAQPNYQYYPTSIPTNDTSRDQLWGLDNIGQTINGYSYSGGVVAGTPDADIDAPEAWTINEGTNASVIVAVIDSGVAYNHPDLIDNMWNGLNCKDENGNALGGCNHGYDYEDNDKTPLPTNSSHGTHIAGTISAVKGNGKGIIGVAPNAKIMALKSSLTTSDNVKSINFAKQNGAKVINASWGSYSTSGEHYDIAMYNAIKDFPGLFVVAAGNAGYNHDDGVDAHKSYPDGFKIDTPIGPGLENIIVVAATDQNDALASFSDYGAISVDVGAPGTNIYSTVADSIIMSEDFEGVMPPNIGSKFTQSGSYTWGTKILNDGSIKAILGDYANWGNYQNNILSNIDSLVINLSGKPNSSLNFEVFCDSEAGYDGIVLSFWDGSSWVIQDAYSGLNIWLEEKSLSNFAISNFKFRFTWLTDESIAYTGCLVDNINITKFSDGTDEKYDYYLGTSMATPHVAGLAALIEGFNPNLTLTEVKNIILTTGDSIPSLSGKTVSGKRINAQNALQAVNPAPTTTYAISGTVKYYDGVKVVSNAIVTLEDNIGTIATTTTDVNGFYEFTGVTAGGDYVVRIFKDDNYSSKGVTVSDLINIKKHTLGTELTNIFKIIAADFNSNLSISVSDLIMLKKFTLLRIDGRPTFSWKFYSSNATLTTVNYLAVGLTRNFTNLTVDKPNQDFVGVKMGDVNNS
ncbi:MAG: S8 family serine peptidase, partial [Candidatus Magasanikbacteria bacterium]